MQKISQTRKLIHLIKMFPWNKNVATQGIGNVVSSYSMNAFTNWIEFSGTTMEYYITELREEISKAL